MLWCRDGNDDEVVVVVVATDAEQKLQATSLAIGVAGVTYDRRVVPTVTTTTIPTDTHTQKMLITIYHQFPFASEQRMRKTEESSSP